VHYRVRNTVILCSEDGFGGTAG